MDHDRLFKQLLREFFADFLALFLPDVSRYIEPGSFEFQDKEVFTDLTAGERHAVDLLVKCRFRGQGAFFLTHIEPQASAKPRFPRRMFGYFARLTETHDLPVYPVALLTFDAPRSPNPDRYEVTFPDLPVLKFQFRSIQLNNLSWRDFVNRRNPVAAALMTKMRIAREDRPRVQLECLRMLVTLKLNPARQALIRDFMNAYLRLNAAERRVYDVELKQLELPEQETIMAIVDQWEERGEERGRAVGKAEGKVEGMADILFRLIHRRFGEDSSRVQARLLDLPPAKIEAIADALFEFTSLSDVEKWLAANG